MAILSNGKFYGFLCSVKETGRKLANGVKEYVEDFVSGFSGHGWKLWEYVKGKWKLEIDTIVVRETMLVFEMLISKVRAIIGAQAITQGHGKVKSARLSDDGTEYLIELEGDDVSIVAHDFVRCQTFTGDKAKLYHVEVSSVDIETKTLHVPLSEFEQNESGNILYPPAQGDELIQFGNSQNKARQSAIYMHADETGQPAIDVMFDLDSKNWEGKVKISIGGNIPGSEGQKGFYCINGMIQGVSEDGTIVYQINPDGSGFLGRGGVKWEKDGFPQFSGTILVKVDENNVWEVDQNCVNYIGNKQGKHIEINPVTSDIKIFDEQGRLSSAIEGNKYTGTDALFGGTAPVIGIINVPINNVYNLDYSVKRHSGSEYITRMFYSEGNVTMSFHFYTRLEFRTTGHFDYSLTLSLMLYSWENADRTVSLGGKNIYTGVNTDEQKFSEGKTLTVPLKKGYHEIMVVYSAYAHSSIKSDTANATIALEDVYGSTILENYTSKYYANGLILGTSTDNLFSVQNTENNILESVQCNPSYGIMFNNSRLNSKRDGKWGLIPSIVCSGYVKTINGIIYFKSNSWDGRVMGMDKLGEGYYRINLPEVWINAGVKPANCYVMLTGIGWSKGKTEPSDRSSTIKATLWKWDAIDAEHIYIVTSDDYTPNDGDFFFEIKYW